MIKIFAPQKRPLIISRIIKSHPVFKDIYEAYYSLHPAPLNPEVEDYDPPRTYPPYSIIIKRHTARKIANQLNLTTRQLYARARSPRTFTITLAKPLELNL